MAAKAISAKSFFCTSHVMAPRSEANQTKLSTSPTQRNIMNAVLGDTLFQTWYPSFYPEELVGRDAERLYVCRWCFKYSKEVLPYLTHTVRRSTLLRYKTSFGDLRVVEKVADLGPLILETVPAESGRTAGQENLCESAVFCLRDRWRRAQGSFTRAGCSPTIGSMVLMSDGIALRAEPLPLRQTLPRQQVCFFRRHRLQLLPPHPRPDPIHPLSPPRRILLQGKNVLG